MSNDITHFYPNTADFSLHQLAGVSRAEAAQICNVHPRTYNRWCQTGTFPAWAKKYFFILSGRLAYPGFEGWQIQDGKLYSPDLRDGFTAREIEKIPYMRDFMRIYTDRSRPGQYILL